MPGIRAVLFDLDGTLVDTAADMAAALNRLLQQEGYEILARETIRPIVSKGSPALVRLGFNTEPGTEREATLRQQFLQLYSEALCVESRLFDGMSALLDELDNRDIRWGVVTNKPGWLTGPLLEQLALAARCACIVSGDTLDRRKPHPEPLLHACELIDRDPAQTVYIGDDQRDVQAGRAAGIRTLVAGWGYIGEEESPRDWGADAMIDNVDELRRWLMPRLDGHTL